MHSYPFTLCTLHTHVLCPCALSPFAPFMPMSCTHMSCALMSFHPLYPHVFSPFVPFMHMSCASLSHAIYTLSPSVPFVPMSHTIMLKFCTLHALSALIHRCNAPISCAILLTLCILHIHILCPCVLSHFVPFISMSCSQSHALTLFHPLHPCLAPMSYIPVPSHPLHPSHQCLVPMSYALVPFTLCTLHVCVLCPCLMPSHPFTLCAHVLHPHTLSPFVPMFCHIMGLDNGASIWHHIAISGISILGLPLKPSMKTNVTVLPPTLHKGTKLGFC